jgi:acetyl-CoA synthetase
MLCNELPLWEVKLAAIKLGAVLIQATSLLTTEGLADRFERGEARHVVTASAQTAKFEALHGDYTRISIGAPVAGWLRFEDAVKASLLFEPEGITHADDPMLVYFTSGTTAKPKLVLHTTRGAASSRPGMPGPASSSSTTRVSMRTACWRRLPPTVSRARVRHRPSGAC